MIPKNRAPMTPGAMLKKNFLKPNNITYRQLADAAGLSHKHWNRIANDAARMTAESALRLSKVFRTTPELWLNAQQNVDMFKAQQALKAKKWKAKALLKRDTPSTS